MSIRTFVNVLLALANVSEGGYVTTPELVGLDQDEIPFKTLLTKLRPTNITSMCSDVLLLRVAMLPDTFTARSSLKFRFLHRT